MSFFFKAESLLNSWIGGGIIAFQMLVCTMVRETPGTTMNMTCNDALISVDFSCCSQVKSIFNLQAFSQHCTDKEACDLI